MNIRRHNPKTHLGRLLASVAEHDIRDDHDPWPLVAGRMRRHEVEKIERARQWWVEGLKLAAAGLVVGLIGIVLALTFRLATDEKVAAPSSTPVVMPSPSADLPSAGRVTTTIPLAIEGRPAFDDERIHPALWIPQPSTGSLTRFTPSLLSTSPIPIAEVGAGAPVAVATTDDSVWIATDRAVVQFDLATNTIEATIELAGTPTAIATGLDSVWITTRDPDTLVRIDIDTRAVVATVPDVLGGTSLVVADDAVWVLGQAEDTVLTRADPASNQIAARIALDLPNLPGTGDSCQTCTGEVTTAAGDVWVAVPGRNALLRVDATTNQVAVVIPVGQNPVSVVADDRGVWIGHASGDGLYLIDPETNSVVAVTRLTTPQRLSALVAHDGVIWAASDYYDVIVRVEPQS
jgi:streptogramin lyase